VTAAPTLADLEAAAARLMDSDDATDRAIGLAIIERLAGEVASIDHAVGLRAAGPGNRTPATKAAEAARNEAIVALHVLFGWPARRIAARLASYARSRAWDKDRIASFAPTPYVGTTLEYLWRAMKADPTPDPVKRSQINDIISSRRSLLTGHQVAQNDNIATMESADAHLPVEISDGITWPGRWGR